MTNNWAEWLVTSNDALIASTGSNPRIRGGKPCLAGTRVTLGQILAELADTQGPDEVAARLDLDAGRIREALNGLAQFLEDDRIMSPALTAPVEPLP